MTETSYEFDMSSNPAANKIIKVVGVGGGGGNAVRHMYELGIHDVDFFIANTDKQALESSPVPNKVQLGLELTDGLGAGAKPEIGRESALETKDEIKQFLSNGTKMVFITAGMGGGTGTGAAPVIAEIARSLGILTVGIVTMPFRFEGKPKERRALTGIEELKEHCDTVLVILNEKLKEVYGRSSMREAFSQADNVLARAAKSIAEIITVDAYINVDFEDVNTVMREAGTAVMGSSIESGEDRAIRATEQAIASPLLNNTDITNAKYILLSLVVSDYDDLDMAELEQVTTYIQDRAGEEAEVIFGVAKDESLGDAISVTVIATGFETDNELPKGDFFNKGESGLGRKINTPNVTKPEPVKVEVEAPQVVEDSPEVKAEEEISAAPQTSEVQEERTKTVYSLEDDYDAPTPEIKKSENEEALETPFEGRLSSYKKIDSMKDISSEELKDLRDVPAYLRRGVKLNSSKEEE
ncbi:cell division protein FtsZ [Flammeovirga yaeyamensis]|uniref:Cell division protein FtsZ n=1 Tax=Flammeovirga yaeyamensis TaxID=367791 RepID=A0AAX1N1G3_9BACT|nr:MULTISPECIES: cell division protein FtsZ [Flammeovirga]ANQ47418.1 cell division protein FtsZ [Flammeovirga sp. MY04]MBB3698464.1 cell division protein FtsZ [Flammeovirga yaeyamensis]NMF34187.1 cell division protein FtsZ [Flammeovirga yaeyamensis]QWG01172.1 cell division protein FtsZ [Flammeovirga yaeyamensis]